MHLLASFRLGVLDLRDNKVGKVKGTGCSLCQSGPETEAHLFLDCPVLTTSRQSLFDAVDIIAGEEWGAQESPPETPGTSEDTGMMIWLLRGGNSEETRDEIWNHVVDFLQTIAFKFELKGRPLVKPEREHMGVDEALHALQKFTDIWATKGD